MKKNQKKIFIFALIMCLVWPIKNIIFEALNLAGGTIEAVVNIVYIATAPTTIASIIFFLFFTMIPASGSLLKDITSNTNVDNKIIIYAILTTVSIVPPVKLNASKIMPLIHQTKNIISIKMQNIFWFFFILIHLFLVHQRIAR